ncbi:hypothetical protein KO481_23845 [Nocardia sp. NEAU-G5]|uniref:Tn3 transposase DDE domain-containing protein n=1 Tax=Nocardia albiluteola TaxID=2842303 RepID=A0ABS6B2N2_9NOCA|nr:hypothetical protein [Nocardia albiluteola]MBU3064551.1 hypothetical protein [Nocardia albiluteola]
MEQSRAGAPDPDDLATITPYTTRTIRRFGDWVLNLTPPEGEPVTRLDLEPRALFPTAYGPPIAMRLGSGIAPGRADLFDSAREIGYCVR